MPAPGEIDPTGRKLADYDQLVTPIPQARLASFQAWRDTLRSSLDRGIVPAALMLSAGGVPGNRLASVPRGEPRQPTAAADLRGVPRQAAATAR